MFNNDMFFLICYLICAVLLNECYKVVTRNMIKASTLTVLIELIAGLFSLLWIPFFSIKVPINPKTYISLGLAIIFYTIQDRLATTARSGIESSTYGILKQLSSIFMIIMGFLFLKEKLTFKKVLGSILLIGSNILIFSKKNNCKNKKYIKLGMIANLCMGIALFFDVNISDYFNLPFYVSITLLIPAILIMIIERINLNEIIKEWKNGSRHLILLTGISWALMMITKLRAYQLKEVTKIAPLCSLSVILNVIFSYIFLKERDNTLKKIIASILITIGVFMIK